MNDAEIQAIVDEARAKHADTPETAFLSGLQAAIRLAGEHRRRAAREGDRAGHGVLREVSDDLFTAFALATA